MFVRKRSRSIGSIRMAGRESAVVAVLVVTFLLAIINGGVSIPAAEAKPVPRCTDISDLELIRKAIEKFHGQIEKKAGRKFEKLEVIGDAGLDGDTVVTVSAAEGSFVTQIPLERASSESI